MNFLENAVWAKFTLASKAGGFSGCVGALLVVVPGGPFHLFGRSAPGAEGGHHRASLSPHQQHVGTVLYGVAGRQGELPLSIGLQRRYVFRRVYPPSSG